MRLDKKGFNLVEVAVALLIGGILWGNFHLDPADHGARVERERETLDVARFDAVNLQAIRRTNNNITVSFTDENGNSYSAVYGGPRVTLKSD